ncbi:MAG: FoF1 ATP synthase subunit B' [Helicobacteraceae bacterium]|jgi:F-type H+-transporting ATPase subunit b|nr:FoF1 ATP synthase subunit B' [Helicobacteraceae bacterium]
MLDINPLLLSITIVVFLILIAVLNSLLFKPLFNYMNERDASIKSDHDKVGNNDAQIAELTAQALSIVNEAKLEAAAIREKVVAEAKELADSKIEAKRAELAKDKTEFEKSLAETRETLKNSLLSQVPLYKEAVKAKFSQI